ARRPTPPRGWPRPVPVTSSPVSPAPFWPPDCPRATPGRWPPWSTVRRPTAPTPGGRCAPWRWPGPCPARWPSCSGRVGPLCRLAVMDQRLSLVTLGVTDLDAARAFYERLGWTPGPSPEHIVFFQAGGMVVGL